MKLIHGRIGALAVVGLFGIALAIPSAAAASGSHHIVKYKVEKHVTLNGDFEQVDLACETGDYALDGMWRLDHVDQDDEYEGNVLQSLSVYDSYGDGADPALWHFSFAKEQPGDAQLKVFLTCLGKKTAPNTHQVQWTISPQQYKGNMPVAGGTELVPAYTDITTLSAGNPNSTPADCPAYDTANEVKTILVAPGFHISENADPLRLVGSYPGSPAGAGDKKRNWSWQFEARGSGSSVDVNWRCLEIKSSAAAPGNHKHRLVTKVKFVGNLPTPTGQPGTAGKATEVQAHCSSHYKALVAGFWFGNTFRHHMWFLGMDPRPKTRAFRMLNMGPGATVDTAIHCFNDRTT